MTLDQDASLSGPTNERPRLYVHPEWRVEYPWLVQGVTGSRGDFDLRLFGPAPAGTVMERWDTLRGVTGFSRALHARQVHGARVALHDGAGAPGLQLLDACDGHATQAADHLLTVAVADCVPAFLVAPKTRKVAIVHAGWRGVVAGVLGSGVRALERLGADASDMRLHLGPHICADCYEVGPEVHRALGFDEPDEPTPVSLSRALAGRAATLGIHEDHMTLSALCTRCDEGLFYSHRGGGQGRQVGILGIRPS